MIHAPVTLRDCVTVGTMSWRLETMPEVLRYMRRLIEFPDATNEGRQHQLRTFIHIFNQELEKGDGNSVGRGMMD